MVKQCRSWVRIRGQRYQCRKRLGHQAWHNNPGESVAWEPRISKGKRKCKGKRKEAKYVQTA